MAEVIEVLRSREKKRFLEASDSAMEAWPSDRKSALITTSIGRTQVHQCGPEDAPPIILLHGMGATSAMWHPCVAALQREHRIVALDTIGDVGRSLPKRVPRNAKDFTHWAKLPSPNRTPRDIASSRASAGLRFPLPSLLSPTVATTQSILLVLIRFAAHRPLKRLVGRHAPCTRWRDGWLALRPDEGPLEIQGFGREFRRGCCQA